MQDSVQPWLSVVMPTYNGAAYLAGALESIAAQGDHGIEVIAVDDGSGDETVAILRAYRDKFALRVVEFAHTGNWVSRANTGIALARGKYLCFLHQDDAWGPRRLSAIRHAIARWPEAALIVHPCWYINAAGRRINVWRCPLPRVDRPLSADEMLEKLLVQCFVASPCAVFRADCAAAVGALDEQLWYSADWDFWLKLAAVGPTVYHAAPLAFFRIHPASQSLWLAGKGDELRRQQDAVLDRHIEVWNSLRPGKDKVERVARFSAAVNAALANLVGGNLSGTMVLPIAFLRLGPSGWRRYVFDSRIIDRCAGRMHLCCSAARNRGSTFSRANASREALDRITTMIRGRRDRRFYSP